MAYTKLALEIDPAWASSQAYGISPGGRVVGSARDAAANAYVVTWHPDGSLDSTSSAFGLVDAAVCNDAGDVVASVRTTVASNPRLVALRAGKVVADFAAKFPADASVFVSAINHTGLVVGLTLKDFDLKTSQAFSLRLADGIPIFHDIPGSTSSRGVAVNERSDQLIAGVIHGVTHSFLLTHAGESRDLGPYELRTLNNSGIAFGNDNDFSYLPVRVDASRHPPSVHRLPLPPGTTKGIVVAANDTGQSTGYVWRTGFGFVGAEWNKADVTLLAALATGPFELGFGVDRAARILTVDGAVGAPPVLLVPPEKRASSSGVSAIWALAFAALGDEPLIGVPGAGVIASLPNGQRVHLPVPALAALGPESDPSSTWQLLTEMDRRRIVSAAVARIATVLEDVESKRILEDASAQLAQGPAGGNEPQR